MTRMRQSRAFASLSLHFGSPTSGIGPGFVARKTLQRLQMVYEGQGCKSDERSTAAAVQARPDEQTITD